MLRLKQFLMMKEEKMLLNMSDPRVGLQEAGRTTERQENAFVELVNTSFKQNNEKPYLRVL